MCGFLSYQSFYVRSNPFSYQAIFRTYGLHQIDCGGGGDYFFVLISGIDSKFVWNLARLWHKHV